MTEIAKIVKIAKIAKNSQNSQPIFERKMAFESLSKSQSRSRKHILRLTEIAKIVKIAKIAQRAKLANKNLKER